MRIIPGQALDLSRLTADWALWVPGPGPSASCGLSQPPFLKPASDSIPDLAETSVKAPVAADDDTPLLTTYLVCAKQAFSQINLYSKF